MKKIFSNRKLSLSVISAFVGLSCIYLFFSSRTMSNEFEEPVDRDYLFNPETILESASQGSSNIFLPQGDNFEPTFIEPTVTVKWTQNDYLHIANALHSEIWNEPIEDWKLHFMYFHADCEQVEQGPQKAVFEFYKITRSFFPKLGHEETITVTPATDSIWWKKEGLDSRTVYNSSIDLSQLKISADNAFQIAEAHGGSEARLRIMNNCEVSALLAPDGLAQNWRVNYFNKDDTHIFDITIDEHSGEYEVGL